MSGRRLRCKLQTALGALLLALGLASGLAVGSYLSAGQAAQNRFARLAASMEAAGRSAGPFAEQLPPAVSACRALQAENPDFAAWLSIEGTAVDYPVMATPDEPLKYLRRGFGGEWSLGGTPFADPASALENGGCILVYGHNMQDGTIFSALEGYRSRDFFLAHPAIQWDTPQSSCRYEIFAVVPLTLTAETRRDFYTLPQEETAFTQYVTLLKDSALYDTGNTAAWGDGLLVLSTCSGPQPDGRLLVAARRT